MDKPKELLEIIKKKIQKPISDIQKITEKNIKSWIKLYNQNDKIYL